MTCRTVQTRDLVENALFSIGLLLFIAAFLRLRRFDLELVRRFFQNRVRTCGGYRRHPVAGRLSVDSSRGGRDAKTFPRHPGKAGNRRAFQRLEHVGAADPDHCAGRHRRASGRGVFLPVFPVWRGETILWPRVGVVASALLFAAVHAHLPSFAPLFVLGICFTIAYEWSGSLLVSMTMHALFNALALTALAFPEVVPQ